MGISEIVRPDSRRVAGVYVTRRDALSCLRAFAADPARELEHRLIGVNFWPDFGH